MTNFIPIFPLNIVVYPGEELNLHIFEPRYKQLISECVSSGKVFGIPTVLKSGIKDIGTTLQIIKVEKHYDNGEMDIRTKGIQVFKILEIIEELPDKLYTGAIVTYPENTTEGVKGKMQKILNELRHFHTLIEVSKKYKKTDDEINTYDIAHHVGLSLEEEYELLTLFREDQRQEYLQRHLKKIIPTLNELQNLKERIQLNGHFRKLSIDDTLAENED